MPMLLKKNSGFSLLELLVVISIIGILVSISVVAFNVAQRSSRDARRRGDMKAMQDGFEQYAAENVGYESCTIMASYDSGSGAIMPGGLPSDPRDSGSYTYNTGTACDVTGYCVCALLESGAGAGNANVPVGVACDYAAGGDYYCLTSLQ